MIKSTKALMDLKKGDKALRLMERYNPQLGTYFSWNEVVVLKKSKVSVFVESYGGTDSYRIFDREKRGKDNSVYGSATYYLYTREEAEIRNENLIKEGYKVRGLN